MANSDWVVTGRELVCNVETNFRNLASWLPWKRATTRFAALSVGYPGPHTASKLTGKEEVGRATWTLLHTIAAQYPEKPSSKQQKDVKAFIASLSLVYPCTECAAHFQKLLKSKPPNTASSDAFQQWLCELHNDVNKRLGKPHFNCQLVQSRWTPLVCLENGTNVCDIRPK